MLGRDQFRLRTKVALTIGFLLAAAMIMAQGGSRVPGSTDGTSVTGAPKTSNKKADDSAIMAALEDLRVFHFIAVAGAAISSLTLLAVLGLYFRRIRLASPLASNSPPAPYDDRRLTEEIAQLRHEVERFSKQLSSREPQAAAIIPPSRLAASPTPVWDSALEYDSSAPPARSGPVNLVQDYQRSRPSRTSWKEFEARNSSERFECTNVRDRMSRPDEPPRFETSTSGAYLAVPTGGGKYSVFPFFSANPWQLYHDGAMSEVYDFPSATGSGQLDVLQPAVFTRRDSQWNLQDRGRFGQ